MPEKSDEKRKMGRVVSWTSDIEAIAGAKMPGDNWESWLARAARRAGITYRQCKALFYGETSDPKYSVGSKVKAAAQAAREEASRTAAAFEGLAGRLNATGSDVVGEEIIALVQAARRLRGVDRS